MPPRIAFCVTCKGRTQHLKQTLPKNLADNAHYPNAFFVVLDYGSEDDLRAFIGEECGEHLDSGRLKYFYMWGAGRFKMAHAKNVAHRLGIHEDADILVNLDADNYTGPGFAWWIADNLGRGEFLWARMIQRCDSPECVLPRYHLEPCSTVQTLPPEERPRKRGICGRIAVHALDFIKVGGYDEKYSDWGPDDKDFNVRLQAMGLEPVEIPGRFLEAIHHGPKLRYREYPHAVAKEASYEEPLVLPDTCVANFGRFGCGTVSRGLGYRSIELVPVPTRIFGIGMQKTGTTSLAQALRVLGADCAHWTSPRHARNVWMEMAAFGKSPTLERTYAACDLPVAVLYHELDLAYPGSKFILTLRDEVDWLRSVRDHWSYDHNRWRADWDQDCFSHQMHQRVYGRRDFEAVTFLERYRRHNAEVLGYFRDRPGDLLVMRSPRWRELCQFVGAAIPAIDYPRLNRARRQAHVQV